MASPRKWAQLTTRRAMALVLLAALALGLGIPAVEVCRTKELHTHTWVGINQGGPGLAWVDTESPFWPRYWRRLLGRPWRSRPLCGSTAGRELELCEFAHPEIVARFPNMTDYFQSKAQQDRIQALIARIQQRPK